MNMKRLSRFSLLSLFLFTVGAGACHGRNLPGSVVAFRDSPDFYKMVRGHYWSSIEKPDRKSIDSIVDSFEVVYRPYIRSLFMGFVAELDGNLREAKTHYEECLNIEVHEEQSYYTYLDLARVALKEGNVVSAENHLSQYLKFLCEEIDAGKGRLTDTFFGYVPSEDLITEMEEQKQRFMRILEDLRQFLSGNKKESGLRN